MTQRASLKTVAFLVCTLALVLPAWSQQYYLYEPKPVTAEEKSPDKGGVLVTEVPVQKGDTLYGISRKFSGHGMYYPQILLFNKINDPHLIYPGDTIKIPVPQGVVRAESAAPGESAGKSKKHTGKLKSAKKPRTAAHTPAKQPVAVVTEAAPATEIPLSDLKALEEVKPKKHIEKKKAVATKTVPKARKEKAESTDRVESGSSAVASNASAASAGQKLYERAVKAYRQDDFRAALDLFDRYLADNASSPLAADASLYKAECYLKLSSQ